MEIVGLLTGDGVDISNGRSVQHPKFRDRFGSWDTGRRKRREGRIEHGV
ncbi:hypothetical protein DM2_2335 [Halorubrum sp. DM2]|nr:hypothetical protein DM2_2335 [Halorubrum sp. DM2]